MKEEKVFRTELGGKELLIKTGKFAPQANGAVTVTLGGTKVLVTATMSSLPDKEKDYFPLIVDYEERFYAAGRIRGGFIKREGKPSDEAIITDRLIDRSIRPLFPEGIQNEVQIVVIVLSYDKENDPCIPSVLGASLALAISDIPFNGPLATLRIGRVDGEWVLNPTKTALSKSDLDIILSGTPPRQKFGSESASNKINMIEAKGNEVKEKDVIKAILFAEKHFKKVFRIVEEIQKRTGKEKADLELWQIDPKIKERVEKEVRPQIQKLISEYKNKKTFDQQIKEIQEKITEKIDQEEKERDINETIWKIQREIARENIFKNEKRIDNRGLDEIRPLKIEVGVLPRTHGSALFCRGETQALSVVTLGAPSDEQIVDQLEEEGKKRYMHHYNFPPFSCGETGPMRGPGRREIGHGALAEKAIELLLPDKETFPYTMRVVSEILSSNGSTSMASVCGSSLSLMDAGVPIKEHVAGISIGLIFQNKKNYKLLTDIQGIEDSGGDMDFKIAGTRTGITAIQLDTKIEGINNEIIEKTFEKARAARLKIIEEMKKVIPAPRKELSKHAPRIATLKIDPEKIRTVIGPGGRTITEITDTTNTVIDVEEDGFTTITSKEGSEKMIKKAQKWIEGLTHEVKVGEKFMGKVTKITDFGAFVEILPGQEGLVHISQLADKRIARVEDVVKTGDVIPVIVIEIDELGRINLSHKAAK